MVIDEHGHAYEDTLVPAAPDRLQVVRLHMGGPGSVGSFDKPPLSLNHRTHWGQTTTIKRQLRNQVVLMLRARKIRRPAEFVTVQLIYRPPTKRKQDSDNLIATTKVIADALQPMREAYVDKKGKPHPAVVGYGLIPDDTDQYVSRPEAVILPSEGKTKAGWWVELTIRYPKEAS